MVSHFHHVDLDTQIVQVFRHFQSDKASPHNDSAFRLFDIDVILDRIGVRHIAESEYLLASDPFDTRSERFGSR